MTVCSVLTMQFSQSHLTCIELYIFMANSIFCHMLIFKSIKCACDLLRSNILTKHIWIWTVTMLCHYASLCHPCMNQWVLNNGLTATASWQTAKESQSVTATSENPPATAQLPSVSTHQWQLRKPPNPGCWPLAPSALTAVHFELCICFTSNQV